MKFAGLTIKLPHESGHYRALLPHGFGGIYGTGQTPMKALENARTVWRHLKYGKLSGVKYSIINEKTGASIEGTIPSHWQKLSLINI